MFLIYESLRNLIEKEMKISIVIAEYNSLDELHKYAESLQNSFIHEVGFIDSNNAFYSFDNQEVICSQFSQFKWGFNKKRGEFSYAMNQGLRLATGDYFIIANPDSMFIDKLDSMMDFLQQHPKVGAIAPMIVEENELFQDPCRKYIKCSVFSYNCIAVGSSVRIIKRFSSECQR